MNVTQLICIVAGCTLVAACGSADGGTATEVPEDGRAIIIDTDVSLDDAMAIPYLLRRPDINVLAVAVDGTGLAHCEAGVSVVLGLLAVSGEDDVPVACGSEVPIAGTNEYPSAWRSTPDEILASGVLPAGGQAATETASELITQAVRDAPSPPTMVLLGTHTNLAQAFMDHPDLAGDISEIIMMGGAVETAGNTFENPDAEWNLWIDPVADSEVMAADLPISIVPLDATNDAPLTTDFVERLSEHLTTPEAQAVYDIATLNSAMISGGGAYFWDQLAAVALVEPEVVTWQELEVTVLQDGGPANAGTLVAGSGGNPASVAMSADRVAFETEYLSTLTGNDVTVSE